MLPYQNVKINTFGTKSQNFGTNGQKFFSKGVVPKIKGLYINQDFTLLKRKKVNDKFLTCTCLLPSGLERKIFA